MDNKKKENLKSLFTNARTRLVIIFTFFILIVGIIIAILKINIKTNVPEQYGGRIVNTPNIESVPGAVNQTAQYAHLQKKQNFEQAKKAIKSGNSSIPTIIDSHAFGEGVESITNQGSLGFVALSTQSKGGDQSPWYDLLKNSNCTIDSMKNAVSQGAGLSDLQQACGCSNLDKLGYSFKDLSGVCSCQELRKQGNRASEFKKIGYDARRLRACGFSTCELHSSGFNAQQLKDAGFSDGELKGAGFSEEEIAKAGGLPDGMTIAELRKAGCDVNQLKNLKAKGVTASAIRRTTGCSATQLKMAGFTAKELQSAGFTAAELKNASFSPEELKAAGFTARDLLNAGFSSSDLSTAGFSEKEIADAEEELPPGIMLADLIKAGCDVESLKQERLAGVSASMIKKHAGCSLSALKSAGFSDADLMRAGFSSAQLAGFTPTQPGLLNKSEEEMIKEAGCDVIKLKKLINKGTDLSKVRKLNGCSLDEFKAAGAAIKDLLAAGFSPTDLLAAGFSAEDFKRSGLTPTALIAAGRGAACSAESLRAAYKAGVSANTIRETLGCSVSQMRAAGFSVQDLKNAGYSPSELRNAGFSAKELKDAGFSAKELKDAGFSASDLKMAGFTAKELMNAGFKANELKAAGFSAKELKNAGFTLLDLKAAGFSAKELKNAGATAAELKEAGYSAAEMKDSGFSNDELIKAGYSKEEIKAASISFPGSSVAGLDDIDNGKTVDAIPNLVNKISNKEVKELLAAKTTQRLDSLLNRQQIERESQQHRQEIMDRASAMQSAANTLLQTWKTVSTQNLSAGNAKEGKEENAASEGAAAESKGERQFTSTNGVVLKSGDILFAVLDTTVNTDEPSPILATIVSGSLKGSKLIGSFTVPQNADKMIIMFNTISIPGVAKTSGISAYAIDPETARTALSGRVDHHYMSRYGSMFASSFIEGFGNAFQSANTTVTIGGTGGGDNITVQNGIARSTLENAVIGLSTVGKSWGQVAQQNINRPTTIELYSGTPLGILLTQDITLMKE